MICGFAGIGKGALLLRPCVTWAERSRDGLLLAGYMALIVLGFTPQTGTTRPSGLGARLRCRSTPCPLYQIYHRHRDGRLECKFPEA